MTYSRKPDKKAHKTERNHHESFHTDDGLTQSELIGALRYIQHGLEHIIRKTERFACSPKTSEKYREICEIMDSEINAKKMIFLTLFKTHVHRFAGSSDLETLSSWNDFQETLGALYATYLSAESTPEAYEDFKTQTASAFWSMCNQYLVYEEDIGPTSTLR